MNYGDGHILQWISNYIYNHFLRLSVNATVATKRTNVTRHNNENNMGSSSSTTYYVTLQVESGDRIEFHMSGSEYGLLAEGDRGTLTFQGTRYIDFVRQ